MLKRSRIVEENSMIWSADYGRPVRFFSQHIPNRLEDWPNKLWGIFGGTFCTHIEFYQFYQMNSLFSLFDTKVRNKRSNIFINFLKKNWSVFPSWYQNSSRKEAGTFFEREGHVYSRGCFYSGLQSAPWFRTWLAIKKCSRKFKRRFIWGWVMILEFGIYAPCVRSPWFGSRSQWFDLQFLRFYEGWQENQRHLDLCFHFVPWSNVICWIYRTLLNKSYWHKILLKQF